MITAHSNASGSPKDHKQTRPKIHFQMYSCRFLQGWLGPFFRESDGSAQGAAANPAVDDVLEKKMTFWGVYPMWPHPNRSIPHHIPIEIPMTSPCSLAKPAWTRHSPWLAWPKALLWGRGFLHHLLLRWRCFCLATGVEGLRNPPRWLPNHQRFIEG